jgi:carboxyl-terminal processing protease
MTSRFNSILRRPLLLLLACVVVATTSIGILSLPAADLTATGEDRQITFIVSRLLRRDHLSKHPIDDQISRRSIKTFLKNLDPMKVYFYQSDIDEFMVQQDKLDDMMRGGDTEFGYTVFKRFLQRVDERVKVVEELLSQEHDFTVDEEMVTDPDLARYARNEAESRDLWRKRIKYDLLLQKTDEKEGEDPIEKIRKRYQSFGKRMHQFDNEELLEMFLTAITTSFDPHSTYMSPSSLENFYIQLRLKLEGIGAALRSSDGQTVVTKIIRGGAADKHGKLKVEDKVIAVGQGDDGEMVDIVDMKLNDVVQLIRGPAGSKVRLSVMPADANEVKTYTIVRAEIELKDQAARSVIFEEGKKADGKPIRIGVIDLPSFYMDMEAARADEKGYTSSSRDMKRLLDEFKANDVDIVVLDLRRNGGGSLPEAISCTGLFIDRGPVVQVKDSDGHIAVYDDLKRGTSWDGPLVVATSKFSASASEILAGAVQDYGRGLIVGDQATHGKGTVQSLMNIGRQMFRIPDPPNLGGLKVTMQQFYRPNGDSTQKRGVLADVQLPSITNNMDVAESDLDYAVDFDRVRAATYKALNMVDNETTAYLKARSEARRSKSEDFAKLKKNIERYREQKGRKTVTLNEKTFFAQRAELDAQKEDEKELEKQQEQDEDEVVQRNFYFNEVLDIAVDYYNSLNGHKVAATR